ncbi:S-layer homology domain-containing protein [Solibacillus isronensis]|uniref:S-layer homology domain-containing protein n=1 Tax=Solibacillus isronensis TaxID=412383 RepID=UPI0009A7C7B2|nr:S-layer homology domain-containing protein [Solibacillus isronensis]
MKKTLITAGLATGLFFTSMMGTGADTSASSVHYKDVKTSDNFYLAVESLIEQKAISRTNDSFRPYENVTRGQASSIIAKVLKLDIENVKDPKFKDVPKDHQFYKYIAALENAGLVKGKGNGLFGINDPLTRGQMSSILVKGFEIPLIGIQDVGFNGFADATYYMGGGDNSVVENGDVWLSFGGQFSQAIETMNYYGFVSGYKTGYKHEYFDMEKVYFKQGEALKRSQLALMINSMQKGTQYEYLYFKDFGITNRSVTIGAGGRWVDDKAVIDDPTIISIKEISNYEKEGLLKGSAFAGIINNVYAILEPKKVGKTFAKFDNGGTGKEKVLEITVTGSKGNFEVSYKDVTPEK